MKNLKKVLALVLAVACAFTMFAGAAFTDQADIKATDAVDTLVALGVVEGFEDGSFQPNATVTRAQMAKMIYVLRTGKSDASAYNDDKTSFTDIGSHWARGYIKYCQSLGIIAGKSNTIFAPNANVTAQEAAKMLLVTLGYNAEKAGLTGAGWAAKTNALADENGLLEDVNTSFTSACPRQYAAQLIYNAINAATVVWRDDAYTNMALTGTDYLPTVGEKYMGLIRTTVTVYGDKARNDSLKDGELEVTLANRDDDAGAAGNKIITYTVSDITSKIGQSVELLWKESKDTKNNLDKNDKIYGMYNTRDTSVVEATVADIADDFNDANKVKIDGTKYEFAANAKLYTNLDSGVAATKASVEALINTAPGKTGDKIRVLLNDSNKITAVYLTTSDLHKVTAVSGKKVSIAGIGTVDTSENNSTVYDGVKKDDVVVVTKLYKPAVADATFVIEKAVSVTGKLTGYTGTKSVKVDGTSYPQYAKAAFKPNLTDDYKTSLSSDDVDDEVTVYLVNGYARAIQKNSDDMNQYAIVVDRAGDGVLDSNFHEPKAELLFADGSKKTVILHKDSKIYTTNSVTTPTNTYTTTSDSLSNLEANQLVKYVEMSNGQYKVEELGTYVKAAASDTKIYDKDTKAFAGTVVSGDCPLFYTDSSSKLKATKLRSLNNITVNDQMYAYFVKDGKVVAAFTNLAARPNGAAGDTKYGIITSDGTTTNKDGDPYTMYTVWTGEETTVYVDGDQKDGATAGTGVALAKGKLVSFDPAADETYTQQSGGTKDFTILDGSAIGKGVAIAVTDYSESDKTITFAAGIAQEDNAWVETSKVTKALDDDVQIVYIDADDNKAGDSGVGITEFDGTTGYANALVVYDGNNDSNKIVAVIVNTNSDVNVLGGTTRLGL